MATTFDRVEALAAQFHAGEAARNAPKPTARRALYAFVSALGALDPEDFSSVHRILIEELAAIDAIRWELLDDWLARD